MSINTYEIFTKITLQNGVSSVFAAIAKEALNLETGIGRLQSKLGGLNATSLAVFGGLGIAAGGAMAAGLAKVAEHGAKLLDQQDKLQRSGIAYADVLKLQADYYAKIAKAVPTSTISEYLKTVAELRVVTGPGPAGLAAAADLSITAMKVDALLSNSSGKESHGEYYKLLRSAEMKGISTDPAKRKQFTDEAFAYITAFGTKLTAQDYQTFARRGGTAFIKC
jgi:hypothetical protein